MDTSRANIVAVVSVVVAIIALGVAGLALYDRAQLVRSLAEQKQAQQAQTPAAAPTAPMPAPTTPTSITPASTTAAPPATTAATAPIDATSPDAIAKALVAVEVARLAAPGRLAELPAEQAQRLRAAIARGDYTTASEIAAAVLQASKIGAWDFQPFTAVAEGYADHVNAGFDDRLDEWVAARPQEALPLILRAQYHYDRGWFTRGGEFANKVPRADMNTFSREMQDGLDDIEAALRLDTGNPYAYLLRLRLLQGNGMAQLFANAFRDGIAHYPAYYPLYRAMLHTLQPKWGGSIREMRRFVDTYAGPALASSPLKLLYLQLYDDLLSSAGDDCWNKEKAQDCVTAEMRNLVPPDLDAHLKDAVGLYDLVAPTAGIVSREDGHEQFGRAIEPILTRMLQQYNGELQAGAVLELAATAMHSNTQLKQEHPGRNDYMIDKLLAVSWFQKGYYENTLAKAEDGLKDIAASNFTGELPKDAALASIYMEIARAQSQLAQHAAAIAAGDSAFALGGPNEYDAISCYGYVKLKAYETAIAACGASLERNPNSMPVYYWRGYAFDQLGRQDAALKDYAIVAGSHHDFRSNAAIGMSMIYFARKDNQGALDLLDSYPYLYDPDASSEDTLAIAHNNRCYALMQLGRLQEALNACRQSLKHGNIPEAIRKTQELMKRLGDPAAQGNQPKTNL